MSPMYPAADPSVDGSQTGSMPVLLDVEAFADLLGVSSRHVRRLVDSGKCPRPVRLGGCVRWPRPTVDRWIADGCPRVRTVRGGAK